MDLQYMSNPLINPLFIDRSNVNSGLTKRIENLSTKAQERLTQLHPMDQNHSFSQNAPIISLDKKKDYILSRDGYKVREDVRGIPSNMYPQKHQRIEPFNPSALDPSPNRSVVHPNKNPEHDVPYTVSLELNRIRKQEKKTQYPSNSKTDFPNEMTQSLYQKPYLSQDCTFKPKSNSNMNNICYVPGTRQGQWYSQLELIQPEPKPQDNVIETFTNDQGVDEKILFSNKQASEYVEKAYDLSNFGIGPPSYLVNQAGGLAIWKKDDLMTRNILFGNITEPMENIFEEHILRDENIYHACPFPHYDFFYSYVRVYVPSAMLPLLHKITESISYDPLTYKLGARCGGIRANIATLLLCSRMAMATNKIRYLEKILANNIYANLIQDSRDETILSDMYVELVENVKKINELYAGPLNENGGYHGFTFKSDFCDRPYSKFR